MIARPSLRLSCATAARHLHAGVAGRQVAAAGPDRVSGLVFLRPGRAAPPEPVRVHNRWHWLTVNLSCVLRPAILRILQAEAGAQRLRSSRLPRRETGPDRAAAAELRKGIPAPAPLRTTISRHRSDRSHSLDSLVKRTIEAARRNFGSHFSSHFSSHHTMVGKARLVLLLPSAGAASGGNNPADGATAPHGRNQPRSTIQRLHTRSGPVDPVTRLPPVSERVLRLAARIDHSTTVPLPRIGGDRGNSNRTDVAKTWDKRNRPAASNSLTPGQSILHRHHYARWDQLSGRSKSHFGRKTATVAIPHPGSPPATPGERERGAVLLRTNAPNSPSPAQRGRVGVGVFPPAPSQNENFWSGRLHGPGGRTGPAAATGPGPGAAAGPGPGAALTFRQPPLSASAELERQVLRIERQVQERIVRHHTLNNTARQTATAATAAAEPSPRLLRSLTDQVCREVLRRMDLDRYRRGR